MDIEAPVDLFAVNSHLLRRFETEAYHGASHSHHGNSHLVADLHGFT
jgi:hypothetical protein